jgi:hypothetical protein
MTAGGFWRLRARSIFIDSISSNDIFKYSFAIPRRDAPEVLRELSRHKNQRARGMPDARCTRGLACKTGNKSAHEHTGSAEAIRHSLRNGFTAYNALSSATNSSCHRR